MKRSPIPAEIRPEHVIAIQDTAEKIALDLSPLAVVRKHLVTGDYSCVGLENIVSIEWKAFPGDLLPSITHERERHDKKMQRMLGYPVRALVVGASWADIEAGRWDNDVTPASVLGTLMGHIVMGIPVVMAGDHERAGRFVARMLMLAAKRRWRESRNLLAVLDPPTGN